MVGKAKKAEDSLHIKNWPASDRPRERLLEKGPEGMSDAALLAILLRTGRKGQNAVALAREMIDRFSGLHGLMSATQDDFRSVKGVGKAKIAQIMAAMEIVKRQLRQPLHKKNVVENPEHLSEYLKASMNTLSREEFRVLHLNRSKELMSEEVLFRGTVDESTIYPRDVVESALRKRASALIFVHNHPTGLAEPSQEDIQLTRTLIGACRSVDIPVLDHIIIGRDGFMSLFRTHPDLFTVEGS